jgi:hypothetical protein
MFSRKLTRFVAVGAAAVAVAIGGIAIGNSGSSNGASNTTNAAQAAAPSRAAAPSQATASGKVPRNWRPGTGTIITGGAADKVKAAALAKYPGTVNRVLKLSDGSYVAHMFATSGPHHVFVGKDFKITGTE